MPSKKKKGEPISKDTITFKPIMGIRPGIYLTVLYVLALILILFFLLIFPGLVNRHSRVTFTSNPWGAAVRMDDVYIGSTPFTMNIPKGSHRFTLVLPGFDKKNLDATIQGRIFGSLFFPSKMTINETLNTPDPVNAFTLGARSFSEWSFAGEGIAVFQHPMDLSEAAYRIGLVNNPAERTKINEILKASARFAHSKTASRDLIRAKFIIDNNGKAASPLSAVKSAQDIIQYLADIPGSSIWLGAMLPGDASSKIIDSSWYEEEAELSFNPVYSTAYDNNTVRIKNLVFRKIPAGESVMYNQKIDRDFWISETEVTQADWDDFVRENPEWSKGNMDTLISEGLITDDYLMYPDSPNYPRPTVPGVSWFAARAYCDWLSRSLGASMADYTVRLPREIEWEYAAQYSNKVLAGHGTPLVNMLGSLWEWCEEPYVPLNYLPASPEAIALVSSPQRPVKGGAWNFRGSANILTRGSLEPKSCSPFVSFRPVIAFYNGNTP